MTSITMKDLTKMTINMVSGLVGRNITVKNNVVIIDGVVQEGLTQGDKSITIQIHGPAHTVETASGDVTVEGDVTGDLSTVSGDVRCKNVGGSVSTISGDVKASSIAGNVKTVSGDIST